MFYCFLCMLLLYFWGRSISFFILSLGKCSNFLTFELQVLLLLRQHPSVLCLSLYSPHAIFSVADLFLVLYFTGLSCVVFCSIILKVSIMTLSSPVFWYTLLHQVIVLSRFLLSIPPVFLQYVALSAPAIGFLPYTQGSQAQQHLHSSIG